MQGSLIAGFGFVFLRCLANLMGVMILLQQQWRALVVHLI
jgi:hypothetical protein